MFLQNRTTNFHVANLVRLERLAQESAIPMNPEHRSKLYKPSRRSLEFRDDVKNPNHGTVYRAIAQICFVNHCIDGREEILGVFSKEYLDQHRRWMDLRDTIPENVFSFDGADAAAHALTFARELWRPWYIKSYVYDIVFMDQLPQTRLRCLEDVTVLAKVVTLGECPGNPMALSAEFLGKYLYAQAISERLPPKSNDKAEVSTRLEV